MKHVSLFIFLLSTCLVYCQDVPVKADASESHDKVIERLTEEFKKTYYSPDRFTGGDQGYVAAMKAKAEKEGVSLNAIAEAVVHAAEWLNTQPVVESSKTQGFAKAVDLLIQGKKPEYFKRIFEFATHEHERWDAMRYFIKYSKDLPIAFVKRHWERVDKRVCFRALEKRYVATQRSDRGGALLIKAFLEEKHYYSEDIDDYSKNRERAVWLAQRLKKKQTLAEYASKEFALATAEIESGGGSVTKRPFDDDQWMRMIVKYGDHGAVRADKPDVYYPKLIPVHPIPTIESLRAGENVLAEDLLKQLRAGWQASPKTDAYKKSIGALKLLSTIKHPEVIQVAKEIMASAYNDNMMRFWSMVAIIHHAKDPTWYLRYRLHLFSDTEKYKLLKELFAYRYPSSSNERIRPTDPYTYRSAIIESPGSRIFGGIFYKPYLIESKESDAIDLDKLLKGHAIYRLNLTRLKGLHSYIRAGNTKFSPEWKTLAAMGFDTIEKIEKLLDSAAKAP